MVWTLLAVVAAGVVWFWYLMWRIETAIEYQAQAEHERFRRMLADLNDTPIGDPLDSCDA